MCRLALQLLGMLGNVLGRPRHALQHPRHALQGPWPTSACFLQRPRSPTSKRNPLTCCLISCEAEGIMYYQVSYLEAWWYTTSLALQLIRQQLGGFFSDVGLLGPCEKACRGCLGRCKACLGRCEACRGRPRTLPSMPRSCQASLHILGSHKSQCW